MPDGMSGENMGLTAAWPRITEMATKQFEKVVLNAPDPTEGPELPTFDHS
jgi:hypothetical protein